MILLLLKVVQYCQYSQRIQDEHKSIDRSPIDDPAASVIDNVGEIFQIAAEPRHHQVLRNDMGGLLFNNVSHSFPPCPLRYHVSAPYCKINDLLF